MTLKPTTNFYSTYPVTNKEIITRGVNGYNTGWVEFASSEISQTLRDFLKYLNRSNTFCTNLPRIGTGHVGHAKIEISQRIRTHGR